MKSQLQTIGISLASALIGAAAVTWFQAQKVAAKEPAPSATASARPVEVRVLSQKSDPNLVERLSALEERVASQAMQAEGSEDVEAPPIDPVEADVRAAQRRENRESSFSAQTVDRTWAPDAARSFQADFEAFEDRTFDAGPVDCRTNTCRTQLTFDSYDAARAHAQRIVQHRYATNCVREIFTPEPEGEPSGPYTATVYFDCANLRESAN